MDAGCIWRWVQAYAPELNKRCRPYLKPVNKSYRIDETYIKVKGEDKYCIEHWTPLGKRSTFYSPPNAIWPLLNAFSAKLSRHRAMPCRG